MKVVPARCMSIVDSLWKNPRLPMTPEEERAWINWEDEIHIPDLLRDSGLIQITRYRARDNSGVFHLQEFESEEAMEKFLVSERRNQLRHETESNYPGGPEPHCHFQKRIVRAFIPVVSKFRD